MSTNEILKIFDICENFKGIIENFNTQTIDDCLLKNTITMNDVKSFLNSSQEIYYELDELKNKKINLPDVMNDLHNLLPDYIISLYEFIKNKNDE